MLLGPTRGLQGHYYTGDRPVGTPVISVVDDEISGERVDARWHGVAPPVFNAYWFGFLTAPRDGRYRIAIGSDDGSIVTIDGKRLIDNGGRHNFRELTADITLTRGAHAVLVEFSQLAGRFDLSWRWARDGGTLAPVPAWVLSPHQAPYWQVAAARGAELAALGLVLVSLGLLPILVWQRRSTLAAHPRWTTLCVFLLLAIANTWPLATDPAHLGRHDNADTLLNEWTISWVAHQMPRAPLHIFDGNIFYPERQTLAYSESMIVQSAMAVPLVWLGASPVLAYSLLLLAGFTLTGWSMCLVIQRWTDDWTAGLVSGIVFAFCSHALTRIPHLQAQHVEFLPPALLALDALLRTPRVSHAVRLALWCTLQALTSVYLLVITLFAVAAAILARPDDWWGRRAWPVVRTLTLAAGLAGFALLPFLLPYYQVSRAQGVVRTLESAARYAASWQDYLTTPSHFHQATWSSPFRGGTGLFPGAIGVILTLLAMLRGVAFTDRRARMCLALGVVGVLLSFGPATPGYGVLYATVPLLQGIRGTARFGYLATLAVAAVAGFGVVELRTLVGRHRWLPVAVALVIATAAELLAAPLYLTPSRGVAPIYGHIPREPGTVVVEMPFYGPASAAAHASYMVNATAHWQPIVNGYSGFQPGSFYDHALALQGFPDQASIDMMRSIGVTHVVVNADALSEEKLAGVRARPELQPVETFGTLALYRLVR